MEQELNLTQLARQVLAMLEPDEDKWDCWTSPAALQPVSQSACIQDFVREIEKAKAEKKKIFIFGDYDADGILSTTIMMRALGAAGFTYKKDLGFYIPDRLKEGYGLNKVRIKQAHQKGYDVILTVDNGVMAHEEIALAKELGMQVIITDHHRIQSEVEADVLVHPERMEEAFGALCGAGVAYECSRALHADQDYDLILACIASIADVMKVTGQTRALIQQGLAKLNESKEMHVMQLASQNRKMGAADLSFQIIPKLNAIGRLADRANANRVVEYFLSDDIRQMDSLGKQIDQINTMRKKMSDESLMRAMQIVNKHEPVLLVYDPGFHEGIIGLVAGHLMNKLNKSAIVLASAAAGIKGSMRSLPGFDALNFLADYPNFRALGGHANAAGFSLDLENLESFREYVRYKGQSFEWQPQAGKILEIAADQVNIENVLSLETLEPFGPGFECPEFELKNPPIKTLYDIQNGKHRKYTLSNGVQCMRFNQPFEERAKSVLSIESFVGNMQISRYQGKSRADFIISKIVYKD